MQRYSATCLGHHEYVPPNEIISHRQRAVSSLTTLNHILRDRHLSRTERWQVTVEPRLSEFTCFISFRLFVDMSCSTMGGDHLEHDQRVAGATLCGGEDTTTGDQEVNSKPRFPCLHCSKSYTSKKSLNVCSPPV